MRGSQQHMCDLECCSMSLSSLGIIASTRTEKKMRGKCSIFTDVLKGTIHGKPNHTVT